MKKLVSIIVLCILIFSLVGCGSSKAETVNQTGTMAKGNPMVEVDSVEAINEALGCNMSAKENVTDEAFFIINNEVGEYRCTLNHPSSLRFSQDKENDISGCYIDGKLAFEGTVAGDIQYISTDEYKLGRFGNEDGQYVFKLDENGELNNDEFMTIVIAIYDQVSAK